MRGNLPRAKEWLAHTTIDVAQGRSRPRSVKGRRQDAVWSNQAFDLEYEGIKAEK